MSLTVQNETPHPPARYTPSPRFNLQNTESVWWYVQREFQQVLDRPIAPEESVTVTLVVSAITQMLADANVEIPSVPVQRRSHTIQLP